MCGIIGYIGEKNALEVGIRSLKRMEYRGYDSSGFALNTGDEIKLVRAVGRIEELERKIEKEKNLQGNTAILHSRWATHGSATEKNAHPQPDNDNNIFVVHNGIIENYRELKEKLSEKGYVFKSETDTEVLSHLISYFFKGKLEDAVREALKLVKGAYGIAVISKDDPDKIVAARMFSPLVVSVNNEGGFVASDPSAIISYSKKMIFLEDGEIAIIKKGSFDVVSFENKSKHKEEIELDWNIEEAQKGGYPHFMLKEITEQPESISNSIRGRIVKEDGTSKLGGIELVSNKLKDIEKINIIACGTSYYAGLIGERLIEEISGIPTEVDFASEFRYRKIITKKNEAYLFISQSGETADSISALKEVKKKESLTLGIVNVVGSTIARETDAGIYNHAGPEIGVASTKAFTSQISILSLLALFLGRQRNLSLVEGKEIVEEISSIPEKIKKVLELSPQIEVLAKKYKEHKNFLFIGRKYSYPVSLEGALKLKEISYIHSEGYSAGEMKHGPIALIDESFPTIAIAPSDTVYEKMSSNIQEIKARNGKILTIATEGNKEIKELSDDVLYIPKIKECLSPIISIIPLQLFAYYLSVSLGKDPDKPRNLAKSVTVE
jgi:glutamine---fructose-6-phosphate transaminase (isomerizing)